MMDSNARINSGDQGQAQGKHGGVLATASNVSPHDEARQPLRGDKAASRTRLNKKKGVKVWAPQFYVQWRKRFGTYSLAVMFFGTLTIITSIAFLLLLWIGTHIGSRSPSETPSFLKFIAKHNAGPRVVTVCAAAIRTSMDLQLGLLTAALASVILERSGTSLADAAELSIKRASFSGLLGFLQPSSQRKVWRRPGGLLLGVLAFVGGLQILFSAFMSTVLLSDLSNVAVGSTSEMVRANVLPVFTSPFSIGIGTSWKKVMPTAWRFAVLDNTEFGIDTKAVNDSRDTGDMIVAMLPFTDTTQRTSLVQYDGPAAVSNFRTFCYAPEEDDLTNLSLVPGQVFISFGVNGTLKLRPDSDMLDGYLKNSSAPEPDTSVYFHCPVWTWWDAQVQQESWSVASCQVLNLTWVSDVQVTPQIVINITDMPRLEEYDPETEDLHSLEPQKSSDRIWTPLAGRADNKTDTRSSSSFLSLSVCLTYLGAIITEDVTIRGNAVEKEATAISAITDDTHHWDTSQLSQQLHGKQTDETPLSAVQRGLLDLQIDQKLHQALHTFDLNVLGKADSISWSDPKPVLNPEIGLLIRNDSLMFDKSNYIPHRLFSSEFLDVISNTQSLPLAMQTLIFRLWQTYYSVSVESANDPREITAMFATTALLPKKWTGLAIVLGMVAMHFIVGAVTIWLYVRHVKGSDLRHPWQAVAQLATPRTAELMEVAKGGNEKDVKKWVEEHYGEKEIYTVSEVQSSGRYELQAVGSGDGVEDHEMQSIRPRAGYRRVVE